MIRLAARQLPGGDGLLECNEVHRHLVGVRRTEGTHGLIEGRCGPEVGGDRDGIAGSSVRTCQGVAAQTGVGHEAHVVKPRRVGRPLHIAQLTDVILPAQGTLHPAEEGVTRGLHHALTLDDALTHLLVDGGGRVGLQHRPLRLLDLQGEEVSGVTSLQQQYPGQQADTADSDHLVTDVDDLVALKETTAIGGQREEIAGQGIPEQGAPDRIIGHPHHEGWLVDELSMTVHLFSELANRCPRCPGLGLGNALAHGLFTHPARRALRPCLECRRINAVVPDVQLGHPSVLDHRQPVLPCGLHGRIGCLISR